MRNFFVSLLVVSVFISGCAPSIPNINVKSYEIPKDFVYPETDIPFIKNAIALHAAAEHKDLTKLFTATAPPEVSICGLSPDVLRAQFIQSDAAKRKIEKTVEKALLRSHGTEMSIKFSNEDPDFQIMEATCPVQGSPGSITVRFNTGISNDSAILSTSGRGQNIGILSITQDLQPLTITQFVKAEGTINTASTKFNAPTAMNHWLADETQSVTFMKTLDMDNVIFTETTSDKKRQKMTSWIDGKLASITNHKGAKNHGESIVFARKMKIPGSSSEFAIPEIRSCFKDGLLLKTVGPCVVD